MKLTGLPGAKKRSAADDRAKARKLKLATSEETATRLEPYLEPHLELYLEPYLRPYLEPI
jgi:hypothetical protein